MIFVAAELRDLEGNGRYRTDGTGARRAVATGKVGTKWSFAGSKGRSQTPAEGGKFGNEEPLHRRPACGGYRKRPRPPLQRTECPHVLGSVNTNANRSAARASPGRDF